MNRFLFARGFLLALAAAAAVAFPLRASDLDPALQAKVDAKVAEVTTWAADPAIVAAVAEHNAQLPPEQAEMTQEKWRALSLLDPFIRSFSTNPAGAALKAKKADWTTEAFVSDAKGLKVAFLAKPSNWSHAGMPKHEQPMQGKTWQGAVAIDDSTGLQQLQVSVPVLKDGRPIGSLVVGISTGKL